MHLAALLCILLSIQDPPVMHRSWTYLGGERTEVLAVRGEIVYFNSRNRTGAIDLVSGKILWEQRRPDWSMCSVIADGDIFVSTSSERGGRLLRYGVKDGQVQTIRKLGAGPYAFVTWREHICLLLPGGKLLAFSPGTQKVFWEVQVGSRKDSRQMATVTGCGDVIVVGVHGVGWLCLDAQTGKTLWQKKAQYATNNEPCNVGGKIILQHPQLMLVEPQTGQEVWVRKDVDLELFGVSSGVLIGES